jgi:hypothetical protein
MFLQAVMEEPSGGPSISAFGVKAPVKIPTVGGMQDPVYHSAFV